MAALTVVNASSLDGAQITLGSATVGGAGDTLTGGTGVHLIVQNTGGSSLNVVLKTPETVEGNLQVDDRTVPVAAGTFREIPVPSRYNDATTGLATVTFSAAANVAAARTATS